MTTHSLVFVAPFCLRLVELALLFHVMVCSHYIYVSSCMFCIVWMLVLWVLEMDHFIAPSCFYGWQLGWNGRLHVLTMGISVILCIESILLKVFLNCGQRGECCYFPQSSHKLALQWSTVLCKIVQTPSCVTQFSVPSYMWSSCPVSG